MGCQGCGGMCMHKLATCCLLYCSLIALNVANNLELNLVANFQKVDMPLPLLQFDKDGPWWIELLFGGQKQKPQRHRVQLGVVEQPTTITIV